MKDLEYFQQLYLNHRRRFLALGYKPMTLSQFYDAVYDPIIVPTFVKRHV